METINSIKVRTVKANELKDKMNDNNIAIYDVDNESDDNIWFGGHSVLNDSIYLRFATDKNKGCINAKDGAICRDYIYVDFGKSNKLRTELYEKGFTIQYVKHKKDKTVTNTIHYQMLMRSTSHAKRGECLFINSEKHKKHLDYLTMGLYDKMDDDNADIVKMSAYMTLTTATSLGYLKIPWDNILVIKDIDEVCRKKAVLVKTNNDGEIYCDWSDSAELKNTIFDGQGLIDESIFPKETDHNGKPIFDGFVYCRNHFFKSCLFRGNIQEFFKDHYKDKYESAKVTDIFGVEHYVKNIKVIVSTESLKWLKFTDLISDDEKEQYRFYDEILSKDHYQFQIIKTGHPSKYGSNVRASCQIISSLPCVGDNIDESLEKLIVPTVEFITDIKRNTDKYIEHIKNTSGDYNVDKAFAAIYKKFPDFQYTVRFKERKKKVLSKFRKYATQGKMLFEGDNLTICDNPFEMLKASVGEYIGSETFAVHDDVIECYTDRFDDKECMAAFRSPHNAPHGILHLINNKDNKIQKYFPNAGKNVIFLNAIGTDWQDRTNSGDCDSDFLCTTNNEEIVRLAKIAYNNYRTIINKIPSGKKQYKKTMAKYAEMDNLLAESQLLIGISSNKAQVLLDIYYDKLNDDNDTISKEDLKRLEEAIIIEAVLAQACIDSCKNDFEIKLKDSIEQIGEIEDEWIKKENKGEKDEKKLYPKVYAEISDKKGYTDYECTMDQVNKILSKTLKKVDNDKDNQIKNDRNISSVSQIFKIQKQRKTRQSKTINDICKEYERVSNRIIKLYDENKIDHDTYKEEMNDLLSEYGDEIATFTKDKLKGGIKKETMQSLLHDCFFPSKMGKKGDRNTFANRSITLLYNADPELFMECLEPIQEVSTNE